MTRRKAFKIFRILLVSLLGLVLVSAAGLYVYFFEPYLAYSEQRASSAPETIRARYMAYACGEFHPQLYELFGVGEGEVRASEAPTTLALPAGLPSPDRGGLSFAGNVFELTGYRYRRHERNRLTGASREVPSTRFDVVAWRVETPYRILSLDGQSGNHEVRDQAFEPIGHKMAHDDHAPANFEMQRYSPCQ